MKMEAPFYSQKWDLSQWKNLGFESFEDAKYWEKSSCGILCLKMAIDAFLQSKAKPLSPSIAQYIKKGVEIGAYKDSTGWSHGGLARLAKEFGFSGVNRENVSATELREALKQNFLPLISIKWAFENYKTLKEKILFWKKFGGHLALIVGFEEENGKLKGFYVHHTSIRSEYNWQYKFLSLQKFEQGFTGRCIIIKS
ncbi:MAG: C39 family peptidase [Candidatus Pacebacteria bacterium]|nr:C39 family peptidase [Candidatus Paceibacterota bacterium]